MWSNLGWMSADWWPKWFRVITPPSVMSVGPFFPEPEQSCCIYNSSNNKNNNNSSNRSIHTLRHTLRHAHTHTHTHPSDWYWSSCDVFSKPKQTPEWLISCRKSDITLCVCALVCVNLADIKTLVFSWNFICFKASLLFFLHVTKSEKH